ncbi:DNA-binding helix-turn-helix protein [Leptospira yanagawae serovar Saopaulo str. Sao Paulo = ATCC 700523]|uniref:DNA-binding helix-turn-helix protein n=1 Tax=Leptospira yanagawae serovar Saopaulo str. Sao Paulo = ATCC 700523 TaxID=1249483 RepID=A0A5E8HG26_9LEPT|nr:helix-turn-helix domain-containing protein [Leptospira yanagawae]EOQ90431.1 DNA-binding helix-turn-helix protein [Leptospira yanagawae serovar Saopaulo str. Sao Paulo = ATCC 700523]
MDGKRKGSLFYFGERILLGTQGLVTEPHSHYAVSILVSKQSPFQLVTKEKETIETEGIIIPPNFFHRLEASHTEIVVIQLDPKSEEYKKIEMKDRYSLLDKPSIQTIQSLAEPLFTNTLNCQTARKVYEEILEVLGSTKSNKEWDQRINVAVKKIKETLPNPISLAVLSKETGISKDRFMHLFKENMGIPLRQYLLWQRLHIAARLLQNGENLTTASHAAGFSDQAHLSRTFKKMFGVKPSLFLGGSHLTNVCFCETNPYMEL